MGSRASRARCHSSYGRAHCGPVGLLATEGTVKSHSYNLEIAKLWPKIHVTGVACPFWVPLVEYNEADSPGADYFVKKRIDELMSKDPAIDAIILGCTHYPILLPKIQRYVDARINIVSQGKFVAESLKGYLERHPEIERDCTQGGRVEYYTTENPNKFKEGARIFLHEKVKVEHIDLE